MAASKQTRSPSTEAVMEAVERVRDYLYWLRPKQREYATPSRPRLDAALEALRAAGLASGPIATEGWSVLASSAVILVHDLYQFQVYGMEPDEDRRQELDDQLGRIEAEMYFVMGWEFDELPPIVTTESKLARAIAAVDGECSKTRLFKRFSEQGRIIARPIAGKPNSRYREVWFLVPGEHPKYYAAWLKLKR